MDSNSTVEATATATENVELTSCDVGVLRWLEPCWDVLPDQSRIRTLESMHDYGVGTVVRSHNTTCIGLDEYRAANLAGDVNQSATALAVGTGTATPAHDDTELTDEHTSTALTEAFATGEKLTVTSFLSREEANGATLSELGVYAGPYLLNHSRFSPVDKTKNKAIIFQIELTFTTADK